MTDHMKRHCVEWIIGATLLLAAAIWNYWPSLEATQRQDDLDFYAAEIRKAPCDLSVKERLLDHLDVIEDRIGNGKRLDYTRWRRRDTAIRELLKRGLHHDTGRLVERELRRIEHDLGDEKWPTLNTKRWFI